MRKKTWKREVAVAQLSLHWLLVMLVSYIAFYEVEANVDALVSLATGLAVWVYGFAGAAFGMDAWSKQMIRSPDNTETQSPESYSS